MVRDGEDVGSPAVMPVVAAGMMVTQTYFPAYVAFGVKVLLFAPDIGLPAEPVVSATYHW